MIGTLLRIARLSLRRDRVAQALIFVLPISFFSIFALVFGGQNFRAMPRVNVLVVDEDHSTTSRALIESLRSDGSLRVRDSVSAGSAEHAPLVPLDRADAERRVKNGEGVAVVLPAGWGAAFPDFGKRGPEVTVFADPADPVARQMITGLLQRDAGRMMVAAVTGPEVAPELMLVRTHVVDVNGDRRRGAPMVAFYAAGIAVMFLLFSASSGGGALLDEQESGTLERVLGTRVGMSGLLAGKWLHLMLVGVTQITVMFVWGMLVFHLDLMSHLPGFAIMTVATAAAAAAFGLVLATASRTRQQLSGISTLVILAMSALGGSMFPRFLMSPAMQKIGLVTFNAWALDGYLKVFWRELPLVSLAPQLGVLAALTAVFLTTARLLARRWEAE